MRCWGRIVGNSEVIRCPWSSVGRTPATPAQMPVAYTQTTCSIGAMPTPRSSAANTIGQTLLSHSASLYPHSTPQVWQQNLNNGEVTLNGVTASGSESVTSGQTLVWNRPPWSEPDSPQHFDVLFDDLHLLAVNKPSGLSTLPGGGSTEHTLLRLVQKQFPHASPVHRLGRGTSGVVLFAKTRQAASNLGANWNIPNIQKLYRALAQNIAQRDANQILTPIRPHYHTRASVPCRAANPSGRTVTSRWRR